MRAGYSLTKIKDGIGTLCIRSWSAYQQLILDRIRNSSDFIWRGHRRGEWLLEPTLDRELKTYAKSTKQKKRDHQLDLFGYLSRARRERIDLAEEDENTIWGLGQHYGLATPLLDWTTSPFCAAYFAFWKVNPKKPRPVRSIFGLNRRIVESKTREMWHPSTGKAPLPLPPVIDFLQPQSVSNPRIISQGGLFTRAPEETDIESWVRTYFPGEIEKLVLLKVILQDSMRRQALLSLNQMNINHKILFPDISGVAEFCNLSLSIPGYDFVSETTPAKV